MNKFTELQVSAPDGYEDEDFKVEYELFPLYNTEDLDVRRKEIYKRGVYYKS